MAASVRSPLQTVHESVVATDQPKSKSAQYGKADTLSVASATTANSGRSSQSRRSADEPHIGRYRLLKTIGKGNFAKVSDGCDGDAFWAAIVVGDVFNLTECLLSDVLR
jgi:MAP/microtubule affinity-regulating kinase